MKIKNILLTFFLTLISVSEMRAQTPSCPTCPNQEFPEMPIDQHIIYLIGAALVLGFVMIYKSIIKKASV
ncbi:hypothetical protein SAMN05444366_0146 [Flavobacterium saccharophilum]|uniref:Uncharacterized protein n=1 Tax=Flavobacterium saccharophilum TaxID=29534 RepID=A0A1M6Z7F0_9FLAO|nr:hypothetical protein SAMN05444366_0146 [Flavobacterium saccharophilum]